MKARTWFRFQNAAEDPTVTDIHIIDFIGSWDDDWIARNWGYEMGVTAKTFVDQLAALPASVTALKVHINSPGGDVQAGINIANALREQQVSKGRTVETFIDGIAASIASVIAMAGSKVHIGDNALMMVHNPWTIAMGNAAEMRKVADILDSMRGQAVATYKWHSSLSDDELIALMDAETWLDADAAIEKGLATDKVQGLKAAASVDARAIAKLTVPEKYRARVDSFVSRAQPAPVAATAVDVLRVCREGGCLDVAEALLADGATLDQVKLRVDTERQKRQAADARAKAIRAMCTDKKLPELAQGYIDGAMDESAVRAHLTTITAALDKVVIDTGLPPDQGARGSSSLNPAEIYAARRNAQQQQ